MKVEAFLYYWIVWAMTSTTGSETTLPWELLIPLKKQNKTAENKYVTSPTPLYHTAFWRNNWNHITGWLHWEIWQCPAGGSMVQDIRCIPKRVWRITDSGIFRRKFAWNWWPFVRDIKAMMEKNGAPFVYTGEASETEEELFNKWLSIPVF
jgi:hypothetical protein